MRILLPLALLTAAGAAAVLLAGCAVAQPVDSRDQAIDATATPGVQTAIPAIDATATPDTRPAIPAIDARAPARVETATFSLG